MIIKKEKKGKFCSSQTLYLRAHFTTGKNRPFSITKKDNIEI